MDTPQRLLLLNSRPYLALSLSASTVAEDASVGTVVGGILGKTPGATITLTDSASGKFAINGTNVEVAGALDYETVTSHNITIREIIPGRGPKDTIVAIAVTNVLEVTLAALSLDDLTIAEDQTEGTKVGTITGASSGSTVTLLTQSNAGMFAKDGNDIEVGATALDFETVPSPTITLRETHPDASNSPRDTVITITVTDVAEGGGELFPDPNLEDVTDLENGWTLTGEAQIGGGGLGPGILLEDTSNFGAGLAGTNQTAFNAAVANSSTKSVSLTFQNTFSIIGPIFVSMKGGTPVSFIAADGMVTHSVTAGTGSGFLMEGDNAESVNAEIVAISVT